MPTKPAAKTTTPTVTIPAPSEQLLTPQITRLIQDILQQISREDANSLDNYIDMCRTSPIIGSALDVVNLIGLSFLGEYSHTNEDIQAFIKQAFEGMRGSLSLAVAELLSCKPLGFACSEWSPVQKDGQWVLEAIQIIDPRKYRLRGKLGQIQDLVYAGATGDVFIPYDRIVHVVNQRYLSFGDPYGNADCRRSYAAWEAWKIVVSCMLVAAKRQAVPILAGYSDSEVLVPLLDDKGQPVLDKTTGDPIQVPAPRAMLDQLENLENNSVISTDINNRIEAIQQQTSGAFFFEALRYLGQLQLMGFLVPETILTATGVGDSNLNSGQRGTLETSVKSQIDQIKEVLLEKVVRPLIVWNFGEAVEGGWGEFRTPEGEEGDRVVLLQAINQAVSTGFFSAADLSVLNRARDLAGLPPASEAAPAAATAPLNYWRTAA